MSQPAQHHGPRTALRLISSIVTISETDNSQQKPTKISTSPLFSVHDCVYQ